MPNIPGYGYIFDYLAELGFVSANGFGVGAVSFVEMKSWSELLGLDLSILEAYTIRKLSLIFIEQKDLSKAANCPPPYVPEPEVTVEQRIGVDKFFRGFAAKRKAK